MPIGREVATHDEEATPIGRLRWVTGRGIASGHTSTRRRSTPTSGQGARQIMECCRPVHRYGPRSPPTSRSSGHDGARWARPKMSKSYHNAIPIFATPEEQRRRMRGVVTTDSRSTEEPKNPESYWLLALYRRLAGAEATEAMATRYRAGMWIPRDERFVAELIEGNFGGARARHAELLADRRTLTRFWRAARRGPGVVRRRSWPPCAPRAVCDPERCGVAKRRRPPSSGGGGTIGP